MVKEDMLKPGRGILLRPWHLSWHQSAGFRGFVDPVRALEVVVFPNRLKCLDDQGHISLFGSTYYFQRAWI